MAFRGLIAKNLKQLRLLSTRDSLLNNYKGLKTLNPKLPILIRETSGTEPQLSARYGFMHPLSVSSEGKHFVSEDVSHLPNIRDPETLRVFKDLMAANWDELPSPLISHAKKALAKTTDDNTGKETLAIVFQAAEAVEEFTGILVSLRMELYDTVGMSGENVKPLSNQFKDALKVAYDRYVKYLESFGPDELYLRKKVEMELGTRLIHLKMRCSGLGSEWGEVTVLGTSGLSGSYVEQRGT